MMSVVDVQDVYDLEKEKVLLGERPVFTTLDFDINIHNPYKPLVVAIRKFQVVTNTLAQVAWNFVNRSWVSKLLQELGLQSPNITCLQLIYNSRKSKGICNLRRLVSTMFIPPTPKSLDFNERTIC
jgi:hypothetical protein